MKSAFIYISPEEIWLCSEVINCTKLDTSVQHMRMLLYYCLSNSIFSQLWLNKYIFVNKI